MLKFQVQMLVAPFVLVYATTVQPAFNLLSPPLQAFCFPLPPPLPANFPASISVTSSSPSLLACFSLNVWLVVLVYTVEYYTVVKVVEMEAVWQTNTSFFSLLLFLVLVPVTAKPG